LLHILTRFQNSFPEAQITVLKNSALQLTGYLPTTITLIEYDPKQSTIFGPPPRLLSTIQDGHFDIAIDASHSFQLIHTALVIASRAKLRICFDHPKREDLYNFIIRLEPNQKYINSYNILLRYLGAK
jgi:ADP-heptose:LPS heptosyltransferase